jgi:hypothetical protein
VSLEPGNWRHQFRLALAGWGEDRLRASDRALSLLPSCAAAHLVAAMVHVARGAWERAETTAEAGARVQDAQTDGTVLPAAGLHWIRGMALVAQGRVADGSAVLIREAQREGSGLYAQEFRWLSHSSLGFIHLHEGHVDRAEQAFRAAELLNPGAARNSLGLHLCGVLEESAAASAIDELRRGRKDADATITQAALLAWRAQPGSAIDLLARLVAGAPPGPTGWNLGADSLLLPLRQHPGWPALVAAVAARAA